MKTFTKGIISILATTAIISGAVYAATWTGLATTAINQWDTIGQGWFQAVNDTVAKIGNLTEGKWCKVVSGKIDCTTNGSAGGGLGVGQTWQNVTASRIAGQVYTNSTWKPIEVNVGGVSYAGNYGYMSASVGGVTLLLGTSFFHPAMGISISGGTFIVPDNTTYKVDVSGGTITQWSELQ